MKAAMFRAMLIVTVTCGGCIEQPAFVEHSAIPGTYEGNRQDHLDRLELAAGGSYRYTSSHDGLSKIISGRWEISDSASGTRVQTWGACFEWGEYKVIDCEKADPNLGWTMPVKKNKKGVFLMINPDEKLYFRRVN